MSVPLGCPVSMLTGSIQSTGPPRPPGSDPGVGPGACHVSWAGSRRRRPKARRQPAGVRRNLCTGHGSARAWARSNKREDAHLVVVVVRPEVAGAVAGEQRGGRRGSGEWRVSSVGHQNGRDRSHSNDKTTAERMGVAVVARVERHGLDGGEVVRT